MIRAILAQQNTRRVASRQWETLKTVYPQWEAALADGPDGIETTLKQAGGGLTRMKADYLYGVLDALAQSRGELSLRFLRELDDREIRRALEQLPGVGMKTASLVMLFDLLRPAMPVDGNIERWTKRLELVPARWNANKVEGWFDEAIPRDWETRYALHLSGVDHGQETCKSQKPLCAACVLREWCPSAALFLLED
ncbi:endonuclease III [Deinococcus cavernae]|uniref:Endonuclease III n=1 Tax=Deinococcus cavernae TaxID=2320857 RepID=A0A418VCM4_9DEIO|nr:endonuclease III [Deinococcus cavernae]